MPPRKKPPTSSPSDQLARIEFKLREMDSQIKTLFIVLKETKESIQGSIKNQNDRISAAMLGFAKLAKQEQDTSTPAIESVIEWLDHKGYRISKRP